MRFIDNKNGTITDTLTGLMWEQKPCDRAMTWQEAKDYCKSIVTTHKHNEIDPFDCRIMDYDTIELKDWRLPTIKELLTLVDCDQPCQADWLNSQWFVGLTNRLYWSKSLYKRNDIWSWCLDFGSGASDMSKTMYPCHVLAVRG